MHEKAPCVYIVVSKPHGTLYIGVTSNLPQRVWQHKLGVIPGFASRHSCDRLVWYQVCEDMDQAIRREKQMKKWKRQWKIELIERENRTWRDLYEELA